MGNRRLIVKRWRKYCRDLNAALDGAGRIMAAEPYRYGAGATILAVTSSVSLRRTISAMRAEIGDTGMAPLEATRLVLPFGFACPESVSVGGTKLGAPSASK